MVLGAVPRVFQRAYGLYDAEFVPKDMTKSGRAGAAHM
jgi:hypothetical protein